MKKLFKLLVLLVLICPGVGAQALNCASTQLLDIRCFGGRAIYPSADQLANGGITANVGASSTTATVTTSTLQNGNGVDIFGAGPANSLVTPPAPTVRTGVASGPTGTGNVAIGPVGSGNNCYKIRSTTKGGGYSAASPATCIANALPLGAQNIPIVSESLSNNILTITTAPRVPEIFVATQMIVLGNAGLYNGQVNVAYVSNNTTFGVVIGNDTRNGSSSGPAAGGTIYYWNENVVVPPLPTPDIQKFLAYKNTNGGPYSLVGQTNLTSLVGALDGLYYYVEDYGPQMMASSLFPLWAPLDDSAPASNDNFISTVSAGGGTNNLSFTTATGSGPNLCGTGTCSNATILLDNGPALSAAAVQACGINTGGGVIYIPSDTYGHQFPVQSYVDLSKCPVAISQAGSLYLNDTINIGGVVWRGDINYGQITQDAWSFEKGVNVTIAHARPGFFVNSNFINLHGVQFADPANNYVGLLVTDGSGLLPIGTISDTSWGGGGPDDYMGIPVLLWSGPSAGSAGILMSRFSISTGPGQITGSTATPLLANNYFGEFTLDKFFLNRRGIFEKVPAPSGASFVADGEFEREGGITPMFTFMPIVSGGGFIAKIHNQIQDTEAVPLVSNLSGIYNIQLSAILDLDTFGSVSGAPFAYINVTDSNGYFFGGQSTRNQSVYNGTALDGVFNSTISPASTSLLQQNQLVSIGQAYSIFVDSPKPSAPIAGAPLLGGGLRPGTPYSFKVAPVILEAGGRLAEGPTSNAGNSQMVDSTCPGSGNCSIPISWAKIPGAVGYDVYMNDLGLQCSLGGFRLTTSATITSNASCAGTSSLTGASFTGMNSAGIWTPQIVLGANTCAPSSGTSECGNSASASVAVPGANPTMLVYTTAVGVKSQIQLTIDQSLGSALGVTCSTTLPSMSPVVVKRYPGVGFIIQTGPSTDQNPICVSYTILN
jgi:hypothetical protein